jgi:hypothetical protein
MCREIFLGATILFYFLEKVTYIISLKINSVIHVGISSKVRKLELDAVALANVRGNYLFFVVYNIGDYLLQLLIDFLGYNYCYFKMYCIYIG